MILCVNKVNLPNFKKCLNWTEKNSQIDVETDSQVRLNHFAPTRLPDSPELLLPQVPASPQALGQATIATEHCWGWELQGSLLGLQQAHCNGRALAGVKYFDFILRVHLKCDNSD